MTSPTRTAWTPATLTAIAAAAYRLAAEAEWHRDWTQFDAIREIYAARAESYRDIAADALCATDPAYPCEASLASVMESFAEDDDLAAEYATSVAQQEAA